MVKIFVGNLNPQSKAPDLRKKFEAFGKVTECDVVNNYGFVHMDREADADSAIAALQGSLLDGTKINIERSHGKRGGPGPIRRRAEGGRMREYPSERQRGPPPRYMGAGPPPPRMGRFGPAWDDGYGGPYGPPPRGAPRGYDYPTNGTNGRYPLPEREQRMPRGLGREPLPPPGREPLPPPGREPPPPGPGYRAPPSQEPLPPRDYPQKPLPRSRYESPDNYPPSRYDNYDTYGDYDRYREPAPPSRSSDYFDNYGTYSSGGNYESDYRDNSAYDSGYDYGYYDYGVDRSPAPPRYNYGRP